MAAKYDMQITKGAKFVRTFVIQKNGVDLDMTGYSARLQVRVTVNDPTALLTLTVGDGLTITAGPPGKITITLTNAQTAALAWTTGVYDIRIVEPDGDVLEPPFGGTITVVPMVTQP